jgi:hypothetical protein
MSKTLSKPQGLRRKRDASPFLDAALEFLFAIAEQDLQKKEPAYLAPSIHEFYTLSLRSTHRKTRSNRSNRSNPTLPTVSLPLSQLLRHVLGPHAAFRTRNQIFRTCFFTVVTALLGYSEYILCMEPTFPTADLMHSALAWYFSHYFLPVHRDVFLAMVRHQIFEKRSAILSAYFPCKPSLVRVPECLQSMQAYFASSEIQHDILPFLMRLL